MENRRIIDLANATGLTITKSGGAGEPYVVTGLNYGNKLYAALDIAQSLVQNAAAIAAQITTLTDTNDAASNLTGLDANLLSGAESALLSLGYYVPQTTNQTPPSAGYSLALLQRLNAPFADSSFAAGGLVHVPVASQSVSLAGQALYVIPKGQTYVFYTASGTLNTVGASLDGHDGGGLYIDAPGVNVTGFPLFDEGTYNAISYNASTGILGVSLEDANGDALGTVVIGTKTGGVNSFITGGGSVVPLSHLTNIHITAPSSTATPEAALLAYLADLGDTTTAASLDNLNYTYQNPAGTAHNVTGTTSITGDVATVTFAPGAAPGAVVAGLTTVPGATSVINELVAQNADMSRDTVSNIQTLVLEGTEEMTGAEFNAFTSVTGGGTIYLTTSGSYALAGARFTGDYSLAALDWDGTTLTGDNQTETVNGVTQAAPQTLTASLYGNDTLVAAANGDSLVAGEGVDALKGSTGNDTFIVGSGLAKGSSITGGGGSDVLYAAGDISNATVTGVPTLYLSDDVTINPIEFAANDNWPMGLRRAA